MHVILTSALVGGEWSVSHPGRFPPVESAPCPRCPLDRSWVDRRAGLEAVEKRKFLTLSGLELRPLGRLASRYTDCPILALLFHVVLVSRENDCRPGHGGSDK